jgi:hypothetical protein
MAEFTKSERKTLRELAEEVYEAEARSYLASLDKEFARWREGEISSSDLLNTIHEFHQKQSRELWSRYQSLKEPEIVARGVALSFIREEQIPENLQQKLKALTEFFIRHQE